jgi:hypothetical protein
MGCLTGSLLVTLRLKDHIDQNPLSRVIGGFAFDQLQRNAGGSDVRCNEFKVAARMRLKLVGKRKVELQQGSVCAAPERNFQVGLENWHLKSATSRANVITAESRVRLFISTCFGDRASRDLRIGTF